MLSYEKRLLEVLKRRLMTQSFDIGEEAKKIAILTVYLELNHEPDLIVILFKELRRPHCVFGFCSSIYEYEDPQRSLDNLNNWKDDPADVWGDMIIANLTEKVVAGDLGLPNECRINAITWVTPLTPEIFN